MQNTNCRTDNRVHDDKNNDRDAVINNSTEHITDEIGLTNTISESSNYVSGEIPHRCYDDNDDRSCNVKINNSNNNKNNNNDKNNNIIIKQTNDDNIDNNNQHYYLPSFVDSREVKLLSNNCDNECNNTSKNSNANCECTANVNEENKEKVEHPNAEQNVTNKSKSLMYSYNLESSTAPLRVAYITWNMAHHPPNEEEVVTYCIHPNAHIIIVATQENGPYVGDHYPQQLWLRMVKDKCLHGKYTLIRTESMSALHLALFARSRDVAHRISCVHTSHVSTGKLWSLVGNKGAVAIAFAIGITTPVANVEQCYHQEVKVEHVREMHPLTKQKNEHRKNKDYVECKVQKEMWKENDEKESNQKIAKKECDINYNTNLCKITESTTNDQTTNCNHESHVPHDKLKEMNNSLSDKLTDVSCHSIFEMCYKRPKCLARFQSKEDDKSRNVTAATHSQEKKKNKKISKRKQQNEQAHTEFRSKKSHQLTNHEHENKMRNETNIINKSTLTDDNSNNNSNNSSKCCCLTNGDILTVLCINAHLAPHQNSVRKRNSNYEKIVNKLRVGKKSMYKSLFLNELTLTKGKKNAAEHIDNTLNCYHRENKSEKEHISECNNNITDISEHLERAKQTPELLENQSHEKCHANSDKKDYGITVEPSSLSSSLCLLPANNPMITSNKKPQSSASDVCANNASNTCSILANDVSSVQHLTKRVNVITNTDVCNNHDSNSSNSSSNSNSSSRCSSSSSSSSRCSSRTEDNNYFVTHSETDSKCSVEKSVGECETNRHSESMMEECQMQPHFAVVKTLFDNTISGSSWNSESLINASNDDVTDEFDLTFFGGDLNYRINGVRTVIEQIVNSPIAMHEALLVNDQLNRERARSTVFHGFREAVPCFRPTYKYEIDSNTKITSNGYNETKGKKRLPAFCDRVLYKTKSTNIKKIEVQPRLYTDVPNVRTSDHRPVVAIFDVSVNKNGSGKSM